MDQLLLTGICGVILTTAILGGHWALWHFCRDKRLDPYRWGGELNPVERRGGQGEPADRSRGVW
jgi:hypothetical protein